MDSPIPSLLVVALAAGISPVLALGLALRARRRAKEHARSTAGAWLAVGASAVAWPVLTALSIACLALALLFALPLSPGPPRAIPDERSWLDRPGEGGITPRPFVYFGAILGAACVCHEVAACRDTVMPEALR